MPATLGGRPSSSSSSSSSAGIKVDSGVEISGGRTSAGILEAGALFMRAEKTLMMEN